MCFPPKNEWTSKNFGSTKTISFIVNKEEFLIRQNVLWSKSKGFILI